MTREPTLPELTATYPMYLKAENLPDNCTALQVAIYSQHSLRHVRDAIRHDRLEGGQTVAGRTWRVKREAVKRWIEGGTPPRIPLDGQAARPAPARRP